MTLLDRLQDLDLSDPKTQLTAAGAVALVAFVAIKGKGIGGTKGDAGPAAAPVLTVDSDGFGTRSDAPSDGSPGVLGWVGTTPASSPAPAPVPTPTTGGGGFSVIRGGKSVKVKAASPDDAITCPAGYVAVVRKDGRKVCTLVDSSKGDPTRYNSFNPAKQTQPDKRPAKQPTGQAGAGPMSGLDTNDYAHDYAGKVGGFTPAPAPITAASSLSVKRGETPRQLAARAFGDSNHLDKILRLNPEIERSGGFAEGDTVRTL